MSKLRLTVACGDYDSVKALKEGAVEAGGLELIFLTDMGPRERHWRLARKMEFDVCEENVGAYFMARDRGDPVTAIPVFLHRRFRHGFMFINTGKSIRQPKDLIGRRIGVKQFQATAIVWMRGILEHEYGVPPSSIEWFSELDETIEFTPPFGLKINRLAHNQSVEAMLAEGELDAVLHPDLIKPLVRKDPRVARLFPNFKGEEIAYYRRTGIFPIMHLMGIRQEIVERHPWVPINMFHAFNEAKAIAMKRMENPRIVPLIWYREAWEEQEEIAGHDPWEYGPTDRNLNNMNTLASYCHEQGLSRRKFTFDDLFVSVFQGRKRGEEFRF